MNQGSETRRTRREEGVGDMIDRRTRHASRVGGQRVMTQNPSLVCAKPPHHVRVKIHRVLRRAESILCDQRGLETRTRSRRSMFGSTCELCLVLSPWRRRSTEESKRVHDAPILAILAVPGMARRQDHGRLYNRYCTRGWSCVATSRCSLATASMPRTAWDRSHETKGSRPRKNH
jgi:hypothetical protein